MSDVKENAILLAADLGETTRGVPRAGEAEPAGSGRRDLDGRLVFNEVAAEALRLITEVAEDLAWIAPLDVDRYGAGCGRTQQLAVGQAVGNRLPVEDGDILELERSCARVELDVEVIFGDHTGRGKPEHAAGISGNVVGVIRMARGTRTGFKDFHSYDGESALVHFRIHANICSLHETDVDREGSSAPVRRAAAARRDPDKTVEIGDHRRLERTGFAAERTRLVHGTGKFEMERAVAGEFLAEGNRYRKNVTPVIGTGRSRHPK